MTYVAKFVRGEEEIFYGVMIAGYTGMNTVFKPGKFALSMNARRPSEGLNIFQLFYNLLLSFLGVQRTTMMIRDVAIKCEDFQCAVDYVMKTSTTTPAYYTIAGIKENEGIIITKDRFSVVHVEKLD